eukprot:g11685.t1
MTQKTLVFCNSTQTAAKLAELLATTYHFRKIGIFVKSIGYDERRKRLHLFREGKITLMVSTDLLARGIDIPDLANVVQFDFSRNVVNHLLRSGRVSRAGSRGRVFNMYDDDEQGGRDWHDLAEAIQELGSAPLDSLFSRRRGFRHMLQRTEAFRQMLLMQGLPLPPHLQGPSPVAGQLSERSEVDAQALLDDIEDEDSEDDMLEAPEAAEEGSEEVYGQFMESSDAQKDQDFQEMMKSLEEDGESLKSSIS